ncbi:LytR/AlgR family response regulator transcription factor [Saccharopolyspora sp. NPDC002376]
MTDNRPNLAPQPSNGSVQNMITGSPSNAIQMRDLNNGNIYINSHIVVNHELDQESPGGGSSTLANSAPRPFHMLAVDDDPEVLGDLVRLLQDDTRVGRVGAASDAAMALRYIQAAEQQQQPPLDAWFLDLCMPGLSGLELARLGALFSTAPSTVFVTASEDHAVDAFDLEAVDYLVKPLSADRLTRAVDRLSRRRRAQRQSRVKATGLRAASSSSAAQRWC